jgi:hypothetical protein
VYALTDEDWKAQLLSPFKVMVKTCEKKNKNPWFSSDVPLTQSIELNDIHYIPLEYGSIYSSGAELGHNDRYVQPASVPGHGIDWIVELNSLWQAWSYGGAHVTWFLKKVLGLWCTLW